MVVGQEVVRFLAQRIALGALVVVFASALTFFFVNLAPGGPASVMRFDVSAEQREALIHRMGLDRPVPERYVEWLAAAVRGDLGSSLLTDEPVAQRIGERLPNTLAPPGSALLPSLGAGIPPRGGPAPPPRRAGRPPPHPLGAGRPTPPGVL